MLDLRIKRNPNPSAYKIITDAVDENDGYCCCKLEHKLENKCVCKEFYDQDRPSFCECGRFYKTPIFPIITLCGSTRFKEDFIKAQKDLTLQGYIVLSVGLFGHSGDVEALAEHTKGMLDDIHKAKIEMSDAIYVINKDGYIGESTAAEIEWATELGKKIYYMEE